MASFNNPDGSFLNEVFAGPIDTQVSASGATIAMAAADRTLFINNSGTVYTTLTVKLPGGVETGDIVQIGAADTISTLTVEDFFGNSITGAPTSLAAGAAVMMRYVNTKVGTAIKWVKWK